MNAIMRLERLVQNFIARASMQHKPLLQDCERKFAQLKTDSTSSRPDVMALLNDVVSAIEQNQWPKAREVQVKLMSMYDGSGPWVLGLKRLIDYGERGLHGSAPR